MEQDREPRDKPTPLCSDNQQQRGQEYTVEKRQSSSISGARKTGELHVKELN